MKDSLEWGTLEVRSPRGRHCRGERVKLGKMGEGVGDASFQLWNKSVMGIKGMAERM